MLTTREQDAMDCITGYMDEFGFAPSVREMASRMFVSHNMAHRYLTQLESKGCIKRMPHIPRAIQIC
ncbi:LexA family transcriptional regulator [Bacillus sp. AFS075034]|uniref:LexA family protein n=1 Tax=Bacillus sp. AFS075034 TaxID=2034281 RepID=UPI000BFA4FCA|nr:LexA family transcriptional regulator [Bacillus sp. AFS075034]PFW63020.1 LexA family transcriptional regulator [Bacillus sp. AFS075034]